MKSEYNYQTMNRVRGMFRRKSNVEEYAPLAADGEATALEGSALLEGQDAIPFSWLEYGIFALLGMAMLWAW
jgi:solute carrier family 29 (equilibrative nucleoside transporter), member 1/2/3